MFKRLSNRRYSKTPPGPLNPDLLVLKPSTLPPEIWLKIAEYLDTNTLQSLLSINHTFFCLGMNARYRNIRIDASERYTALSHLHKLFNHIRNSGDHVGTRIQHICATDDILEGFLPHRKRVYDYPYIYEVKSKHGVFRRLKGMFREIKLSQGLTEDAFAHCTNVESLEILFNGPWFLETKKNSGLYRSVYAYDTYVDKVLELLCHAFQHNLKTLRIQMQNAAHVRRALEAPGLEFKNLEVLDLHLAKYARHRKPFEYEFAQFISRFAGSLRELRIHVAHLGPHFLDTIFGGDPPEFPHLHTLLLCDYEFPFETPRGYPALNQFLKQTPALQHLHLVGPQEQAFGDTHVHGPIVLPEDLSLASFGTDRAAWRVHGASLGRALQNRPPKKLVLFQGSSHVVFDGVFEGHAHFLQGITELCLEATQFPINRFIQELSEWLPAIQSLTITCGFVMIPKWDFEHRGLPSNSLTNDSGRFLLQSISDSPVYTNSTLTQIDIIRSTAFPGQTATCHCSESEVRLWGVMKIFKRLFPTIRSFAGVTPSELESNFITDHFDPCERCKEFLELQ